MSIVHYYPTNRQGRTFVVGDLHGCYRQFRMLLDAIAFDFDKDVMYSTADLIDRGPESKRCLMLTKEPWFKAVQGNHERQLILSVQRQFDWGHWIKHGGGWAAKLSYGELCELAEVAKALPMAIVVGEGAERFNVFHAEFHGDDAKLDEMGRTGKVPVNLTEGRTLIEGEVAAKYHNGLSPSFVGHSIVKRPRMIGSHVYIDTGSYFGERSNPDPHGVSVIEVATQRIWQVKYGKVVETCKT
jgi:serine/threonine protein phosphatase 1